MKIAVATQNVGKLKEFNELATLTPYDFIKLPSNINQLPAETGKTFYENALIKAKFVSDTLGIPAIGDDSGLEVDALDGRPGIYSARWGGMDSDFNKAIKRVYKEIKKKDKNWKNKKIKARFICALSISFLNRKIACVTGKVEGSISHKPKGKNGFGYDPIFIPQNEKKTFGQMKSSLKYKLDHRFKAFSKI